MAIRRKRRYKTAAVIVSAALLAGSVWPPGDAGQKIYAEEISSEKENGSAEEAELLEESEQTEETELESEKENTEESELPDEVELPGETEQMDERTDQNETESESETENTEETEFSDEVEVPEESDQSDEMEEPEQSDETEEPETSDKSGELEDSELPDKPENTQEQEKEESPAGPEQQEEIENLQESEMPGETDASVETELSGEAEVPEDTEFPKESEVETESEAETEFEAESESEWMTEAELESESETEMSRSKTEEYSYSSSFSSSSYWDESWYVEKDFRFVQVEKEYGIVEGGQSIAVYEAPDTEAKVVGEIPYFGIVYVLKEEDAQWVYVESGEVRGFMQTAFLADAGYTDTLVKTIGEDSFQLAEVNCEKADNDAFTYTHTTVQEVIASKQYSMVIQSGYIQEYPKEESREIGKITSGSLVYLLEETEDGWFFVESGESRGFIRKEMLLSGAAAEEMVTVLGEEEVSLAETYIQPEENRSCYFTLKSVKSAENGNGEKIAELALSFAGKLPYVWGGTSLTTGADCSGFVQSVYAAFGISIPRLAEEQGISGLEVQSIEEAQPGDVVYWSDGPHVGIYIGHGQVVQCSGNSRNTAANPGKGVTVSAIDYRPITSIRRFQIETDWYTGSSGERMDQTDYSQEQMELIWAIVAQEDNGSYEGALAVITSAMNRTESANWNYLGNNALSQLMAPGQYCYSMDNHWKPRLDGNVPEYVKQAVNDCLKKGIRNHSFTSFRSTKGSQTGADAVQIGGNWFFGS